MMMWYFIFFILKINIGVRTVDGTANATEDFIGFDKELNFEQRDLEKEIEVEIVDDDEWEPDEDFYVELYNL
jgi:solute carrier family 8 (sodium/calcium exchanger)